MTRKQTDTLRVKVGKAAMLNVDNCAAAADMTRNEWIETVVQFATRLIIESEPANDKVLSYDNFLTLVKGDSEPRPQREKTASGQDDRKTHGEYIKSIVIEPNNTLRVSKSILIDFLSIHRKPFSMTGKPATRRKVGGWTDEDKAILDYWGAGKPAKKYMWDLSSLRSARRQGFTNEDFAWCIDHWREHPYLTIDNETKRPPLSKMFANGMLPQWGVMMEVDREANEPISWFEEGPGRVWVFYKDGSSKDVGSVNEAKAICDVEHFAQRPTASEMQSGGTVDD